MLNVPLISPAHRAHVVSVLMEADFCMLAGGEKACQPAPHAFSSSFSYQDRIQDKVLITVYLLIGSWAMPFIAHLLSKHKILTI